MRILKILHLFIRCTLASATASPLYGEFGRVNLPVRPTQPQKQLDKADFSHRTATQSGSGMPHTATARLNAFIYNLKGYFVDGKLDIDSFRANSRALRYQFAGLLDSKLDNAYQQRTHSGRYRFAQEMYRAMLTFKAFKRNYNGRGSKAEHLMYEINELSVMLYGLCNEDGKPDTTADGFLVHLAAYVEKWNKLKSEKESLEDIPSIVLLILDMDFNRARKQLAHLREEVIDWELYWQSE